MTKSEWFNCTKLPEETESCVMCRRRDAEIYWLFPHTSKSKDGHVPICHYCAEDTAFGLLRDVNAINEGVEKAQAKHVALRERKQLKRQD